MARVRRAEAGARTQETCAQVRCTEIAAVVRELCTNTCIGASRMPETCACLIKDLAHGLQSTRRRLFDGIEEEPSDGELQTYKDQYYLHGDEYTDEGIVPNPVSEALGYLRKQRDLLTRSETDVIDTESRFRAWVDNDELQNLLLEEKLQKVMHQWVRFDSFFVFLVCLNGFVMGLTTAGVLEEKSVGYSVLDYSFFLAFSIEWCIRWRHNKEGLKGMLSDGWTLFDIIILAINALDNILIFTAYGSGAGKLFTMMRVLRLLRLVRLVRLVKLLQELWFLLNGVFHALRILAWALLMLVSVSYIFGLIFYTFMQTKQLQKDNTHDSFQTSRHEAMWASVERCMLTMLEIATYTGSQHLEILEYQTVLGPWSLVLVLVFVFIASLGLVNLCVGVLLITALKLAVQHECFAESTQRLCGHRAVRALREVLIMKCASTLGESADTPHVTKELLLDWVNDESPVSISTNRFDVRRSTLSGRGSTTSAAPMEKTPTSQSQISDKSNMVRELGSMVTGHKPKSGLARAFEEAKVSEDEIELILNESKSVFGGDDPVCLDDFIEACLWVKGRVHPLDVFNILTGLREVYGRMTYVEGAMTSTLHTLQETSEHFRIFLEKYHSDVQKGQDQGDELELNKTPRHNTIVERDREEEETATNMQKKLVLLGQHEAKLSREAADFEKEDKNWTRFDLVFSLVVLVNAIVLGVEVFYGQDKVRDFNNPFWDATSMIWFLVDQIFFSIYSIELGLRAIFYFQMRVNKDFRVAAGFLPQLLFHMRWPIHLQVIKMSPCWVKDTRNLLWLDIMVVAITAIDNFIFRSIQGGVNYSRFLRTLGLLRLLRLARLLHLVRPLFVLVSGFIGNVKLIFWSVIVLTTFLYAGAITVLFMIDKREHASDGTFEESEYQRWGSLGSSMLTLAQIVTYDNWGKKLQEIGQHSRMYYIFGLCFMAVTSLVVFNLITGVMVQAAFQIVSEENVKAMDLNMSMTKIALHDAMTRTYHNIEKRIARERVAVGEHVKMMCEAVKHEFERFSMEEAEARKAKMTVIDDLKEDEFNLLEEESTSADVEDYVMMGNELPEVKCIYDEHNQCVVVHATWCSLNEVAVGFETRNDADFPGGALRDPLLSVLIWDGGRSHPAVFIPETQVIARAAIYQEDDFDEQSDPLASVLEHAHEEIRRTTTNHSKGDLLFTDVPRYTKLRFRFGGNYSIASLSMDCPPGLDERIDVDLSQLYAVDPEVVGLRELQFLLQDGTLLGRLASVNITPVQALMVYQALNVTGTGTVKLCDFIDGLLRVRRPEMGIDAAGAKTFMRRLLTEKEKLAKDASDCNACFAQVVANLRRVKIIQPEEFKLGMSLGEEFILEKEGDFVRNIEYLRKRNNSLHALLRDRRRALKVTGLSAFGEESDMEPVTYPLCSARTSESITSAKPGWD